jgi:hypothetical protein
MKGSSITCRELSFLDLLGRHDFPYELYLNAVQAQVIVTDHVESLTNSVNL